MSAPTTSRFETMRSDIVSALEGIVPPNYRSTVHEVSTVWKDVKSVSAWPTIIVLFPTETMKALDDMRTVFNSTCSVVILAYVRREQIDAMEHDLKRVVLGLATTHAVDSSGWILDVGANGGQFDVARVDLPENNMTILGIKFVSYIQFQVDTF